MVTYWADYSAAKLSAAVLKAAGYTGVIRYIDAPENLGRKHTNLAEYRDHVSNGLVVWLVFERSTNDPLSGFAGGQANARRALAGAKMLGYVGPIFMCCDRWFVKTGEPTIAASVWRSYLDGAASILGKDRLGAYGFSDAMDTALGHATYYWQAGSKRVVRPHVHLWQDNTIQPVVGGIPTDRNLVLKQEILKGTTDIMTTPNDFWQNQQEHPHVVDKATGRGQLIWMKDAVILGNEAAQKTLAVVDDIKNDVDDIKAGITEMKTKLDTLTGGVNLTATGEITIKPE